MNQCCKFRPFILEDEERSKSKIKQVSNTYSGEQKSLGSNAWRSLHSKNISTYTPKEQSNSINLIDLKSENLNNDMSFTKKCEINNKDYKIQIQKNGKYFQIKAIEDISNKEFKLQMNQQNAQKIFQLFHYDFDSLASKLKIINNHMIICPPNYEEDINLEYQKSQSVKDPIKDKPQIQFESQSVNRTYEIVKAYGKNNRKLAEEHLNNRQGRSKFQSEQIKNDSKEEKYMKVSEVLEHQLEKGPVSDGKELNKQEKFDKQVQENIDNLIEKQINQTNNSFEIHEVPNLVVDKDYLSEFGKLKKIKYYLIR